MADKPLEPVGKIATLTGPVTVQKADGRIVTLEVGSSLYRGDLILTGVNGKVGLTLADKSRFALGENAKMRVDELSYQPASKSGSLAVSIMKGVFMFVTGEIAHLRKGEETMKVLTTTATIGIRGTQVAGEVNSDGTDTRFTLLPNPDGSQSTVVISNAAGTQVISENFQSVSISSFFSPPSAPVLVPHEQVAAVYAQAIGVMTQVNATLGLPPPGVTAPVDKPVIEPPGIKSLPGGGAQRPTDDTNPNSNHAPQVLSKATDPARLTLPTTAPIDPAQPLAIKGTDPARVVDPALAPIDPTQPLAIKATDPARVVDPALAPIDPTQPLAIKATDPARIVDPALAPIDPTPPLAIKATDPARVVDPALAPVDPTQPLAINATDPTRVVDPALAPIDPTPPLTIKATDPARVVDPALTPIAPTQPLAIQPIDPALVVGSSATPTSLTQPLATKGTDPSALAVPSTIATDSALTTATQTSSLGDISNAVIFPNAQTPDIFVLPTHSPGTSVTPPVSPPLTPAFVPIVPIVTPVVIPVAIPKPLSALSGTVADGHISGARIFLDQNDNGAADANEDTGISSDGNGHFAGSTALSVTHALMATGGTNTDTGLANTLLLKAPAGASVINPLTTLVQAFIEAIPGSTVASASSAVKAAFGLGSIDLLSYDPIDAADASSLAVQKIAAEIGSLLTLASANTSLNAQMTANAVMANLVMAINGSGALDLTDATLLATLLAGTGSTVTLALVQAAMSQIAEATDLSQIAEAQLNSLTPGINTPPVATDIAASTEQNTALQGQVVATDIDSSNLAYAQISGPTHGHLTLNTNGSYTYTPTPGYSGTDSFSFSAYDGHTHSNIGTVALTVKALPPTLAINDVTVLENAGVAVFTVNLSAASEQAVTVGYSTSDGSATTTGDYTGASGTLTFAPGTTAQTVTVAITDDKTVEPSEAFNVSLSSPTNATLLDALGFGSITDNDNVPTVSSVSSATATEGTALTHSVTLSAATTVASVYAFNLASGTAAAGSDFGATPTFGNTGIVYNATSGEITVPVGVSSFTASYPTVDDTLDEPSETTILNIGGQSGQGTILDNDSPPTLAINDVTVLESASNAVFTVSLSAASGQAVTVGYSTSDSTATAGDYTGATGTLTFAPGSTTQTVTVAITDDKTVESSETFNVSLSSPINATLLDSLGVGNITDNDNVPTVQSVSSATATEGAALTHTVTLSAATTVASVYTFNLAGDTATPGSDFGATPTFSNTGIVYNATSGEITVPVGVSNFTVSYPTVDDTLDELSETTILSIGGQSGQGTILDNDSPPTLAINDVTVLENASNAVFTVSLSAASGQTVTVAYNTSDDTATATAATAAGDYTSNSGTLTFAPGTTAQTVTVAITDDKMVETSETFNVNLSKPTNATLVDSLGVGTITDNDNVPTVSSVSSATATEGAALTHTVTLSAATTVASVYAFNLASGTATAGSDFGATPTFGNTGIVYNATSGEITVPSGVRSFTLSYTTVDDTLDELSETTILSIGGQSGQGTILDNDSPPTLAINDVTVLENASNAVFTVSLSAASGQTVTVAYNTSDGTATATAAGDYTSSSGSLTFAPGTTLQSVTVPILNDTTVETSETFNVNLSKPTNATLVDSLGVGTITDNDNVPTVQSVSSATAAEGTPLTHSVTLSATTTVASVYALNLAGSTATAGSDFGATLTFSNAGIAYNTTSGEITVPSGVSNFTVSYTTVDDTLDEPSETTSLTVGGQSGQGTIFDNDSPPTLAINDVTILESASNAVFTVSLSAASGQAVTVGYSTSDGTATATTAIAAGDYTSSSGTLTFAPGTTAQSVTVPILNDTTVEPSETFNVNLSSPTNATLLDSLGVGTILDNDNVPTVTSVSSATASEGTALTHSVILSAATTVASVYAFNLAGGTATAGSDFATTPTFSNAGIAYNTTMGEITVPVGVSSFTVSYTTVDDTLDEPSETTTLSIGGQSGQGTIFDNDPLPTLVINDVTVLESAGAAAFTISLSAASGQAVTVNYATGNGTATTPGDYSSSSGTLTFAPGSTTQTVTVPITNDTTVETSETFNVTLSSPTHATLADSQGVGAITDNDSAPTVTSVSDATATEGVALVHTVILSAATSAPSVYALNLAGDTATPVTDFGGSPTFSNTGITYNATTGEITVPSGISSFTVSYPTVNDTVAEPSETTALSIGGQSGQGTILDNDTPPTLAINDVTVLESAGAAAFTVSLSAASGQAVTVNYATGNGTATTPGDYSSSSGTLTFAPGSTTQTVTVAITNDTTAESSETFNVNLSSPSNATLADAQGVGSITDNDNLSTVTSVSSATITEGAALAHSVTLSAATTVTSVYALNLAGGTATTGSDFGTTPTFSIAGIAYNTTMGEITVPVGVSSFTVSYTTVDDTLDEPSETTTLSIGGQSGQGTIFDNDPLPTLTINDVTVLESASNAVFAVSLSAASGQAVTVNYATGNGTATTPGDYSSTSGSLTFAPGSTTQTVTVAITNDTTAETSETFNVNLSSPTNATLLNSLGVGTITDDDAPTVTSVTSDTQTEGTSLVHTVILSAITGTPTAYAYSLTGNTATEGSDFTTPPTFSNSVTLGGDGKLTVPTGVSSFTITVSTIDDPNIDAASPETLSLVVGGVTGTGGILDNDLPTITKVEPGTPGIGDDNVVEGNDLVYTVSLSSAPLIVSTYDFTLGGGTATAGADYNVTPVCSDGVTYNSGTGQITVPVGIAHFTVTVSTIDDSIIDSASPETLPLRVGGVTGHGGILDNEQPTITTVEPGTPGVGDNNVVEGNNLVYTVSLSSTPLIDSTYDFTLGGGTATAGADYNVTPIFSDGVTYNSTTGKITVPVGVGHFTVTVSTIDDTIIDSASPETLPLVVGGVTGLGGILDNDAPTVTSVTSDTQTEGVNLVHTVTLSGVTGDNTAYAYSLAGNTATEGSDFTTPPTFSNGVTLGVDGKLTVPSGINSFTITVPTVDDVTVEATETTSLTVGGVAATGTILDNDQTLVVNDVSVLESAGVAVFTVTLSSASGQAVTVGYNTSDGSATTVGDYTAASGALTFAPGSTTQTVTVPILDDATWESPESFNVNLSTPTNATLADGIGIGTIVDNDPVTILSLSVLDGRSGVRLDGVAADDNFGEFVSAAGDVNGDGFADLIVGARLADPNGISSGSSYVVFGQASGFLPTLNLSALDVSKGFRIDGVAAGDASGGSISAAGDVNGDGVGDLIVGAYQADPGGFGSAGSSYVIFGKTSGFSSPISLSSLNGSNGFRLDGVAANDVSGISVSGAGDVNGDGFADLIVGATLADSNGSSSGSSYVVFGKADWTGYATVNLSTLDGATGFRLDGGAVSDFSGKAVSSAGDINGDGFADLIVGAYLADPGSIDGAGSSYVVFGKADWTGYATVNLSSLNGTTGFRLDGGLTGDNSGESVSDGGDINGDGFGDLIVGAFKADPNGTSSGSSYVVFGKDSWVYDATVNLSLLNGSDGFRLNGVASADSSGLSVSAAGDFNGDGFGDLLIGAFGADPSGISGAGSSYLVFGKATGFSSSINLSTLNGSNGFRIDGVAAADMSGGAVSAAGDINGDGFADLMVGAQGADPNGSNSGSSYVIFGGDFTDSVTRLGSATGTAVAERFVGGSGNETMSGAGGADVFHAGAGDDIIQLNADNIDNLDPDSLNVAGSLVDGGSGFDTLRLDGGGIILDFNALVNAGRVSGIERVDLTGSGDNHLSLSPLNVLDLNPAHLLLVDGNAGDSVYGHSDWAINVSSNVNVDGQTYATDAGGNVVVGSHTYTDYVDGLAHVLIDENVARIMYIPL